MSATATETTGTYEFALFSDDEKLFRLKKDGPAEFEKLTGHRPHPSALRRLAKRPNLPLPTLLISGKRYSSRPALEWWVRACSAAANNKAATTQQGAPLTGNEQAVLDRFGLGAGGA